MGWYVHLHVCFSTDRDEGVAELAGRHLGLLSPETCEARWFLENLARRVGVNPGPKGGPSPWGIVGNHTKAGHFVDDLRPSWADLLSGDVDGGPCDFERVLVF